MFLGRSQCPNGLWLRPDAGDYLVVRGTAPDIEDRTAWNGFTVESAGRPAPVRRPATQMTQPPCFAPVYRGRNRGAGTANEKTPAKWLGFFLNMVAGTGFEPVTSGL